MPTCVSNSVMREFQTQLDTARSGPIHNPKLVYLRPKFSDDMRSYEWEWGAVMELDLESFQWEWACVRQPDAEFNYPIFVRQNEMGMFNRINGVGG